MIVQVLSRICECGKYEYFLIAGVDGMSHLLVQQAEQLLQFAVVLRRDVGHHQRQPFKHVSILFQFFPPALPVHVGKVNFDLFAHGEELRVFIIHVPVVAVCLIHGDVRRTVFLEPIDRVNRPVDQLHDALQRQLKGVDRAFQTLEQVDAHQSLNAAFPTALGQVLVLVMDEVFVLLQLAGEYVMRRRIDT